MVNTLSCKMSSGRRFKIWPHMRFASHEVNGSPGPFSRPVTLLHRKAVGANEDVSHRVTLTAYRAGARELVVNFSSDKLTGMTGSAEVYVSYSF